MSTKYDGYAPAPTRQYSRSYSAPSTTSAGEDRTDPISVRLEQAPAYELVNEVPDVPPPSYDSVFGSAGSAMAKTTNLITSFGDPPKKKQKYVPDTYCELFWKFVLVNVIMCSIPIAQMIVGIIYWDQCPLSDKIPLYMVLTGVIWILAGVRIWAPNWVDQKKCSWVGITLGWVSGIAGFCAIGWFIAGSYFVFKEFRRVEYQPTVENVEPMVKVDPYVNIDGPFTNNTFIVTTKEGTKDNTLRIKWNGKEREYLEVSGTHIDLCDKKTVYNGTGTRQAGAWTIFFDYEEVRLWFDDEIVVNATKVEYPNCYFWRRKVEDINGGHAAVTVQFKDKELNALVFGKDPYCNKTLYLFGFVVLVVVYVLGGGATLVGFCIGQS